MSKSSVAIVAGALMLGFGGGLASHAAFPAPAGAAGPSGVVGRAGALRPAANIDLRKIGLCVWTEYAFSGSVGYVNGVSIFPPTNNGGTLSCPYGTYVNL